MHVLVSPRMHLVIPVSSNIPRYSWIGPVHESASQLGDSCPDISRTPITAKTGVKVRVCPRNPMRRYLNELFFSRNRLQPSDSASIIPSAFLRITELQLNGTMMTWGEMQDAISTMPCLQLVEMGYNRISHLSGTPHLSSSGAPSPLRTINLDSNECDDWPRVCAAMKCSYAGYVSALLMKGLINISHLQVSNALS